MPRPQLEPGERVLFTLPANRAQGARAVGGRLVVTDRALRFVAKRIDRATGGIDRDLNAATNLSREDHRIRSQHPPPQVDA